MGETAGQGKIGLMAATSMNIIGMIGAGPFITLPLMVAAMNGPHIIYAWIVGALLASCDGLVYAQFASALPGEGGSYVYLTEAWKPLRLGRMFGFVYLFQVILVAPLTIASAAIGFADYVEGYGPVITPAAHTGTAVAVCIGMTLLLCRNIETIGRLSQYMLCGVLLTVGWIVVTGLFHFSPAQAFSFPPQAYMLNHDLFTRVAAVSLLAMYNYGGYNTVCFIGGEIDRPHRTMPRAIMLAILAVVMLYVAISTVILGTIDWHQVAATKSVASLFIQATFKNPAAAHGAGQVMTTLILFVIAASLYAVILAFSRIPYAAACNGQFFRVFSRTHPTLGFPYVSLLAVGLSAIPFCFFSLGKIVDWLMAVQIITQFIWQCAGIMMLHRYRKDVQQPYRMVLYPIPAIASLLIWGGIFLSSERDGQLFSLGFLEVALVAWLLYEKPWRYSNPRLERQEE